MARANVLKCIRCSNHSTGAPPCIKTELKKESSFSASVFETKQDDEVSPV